MTVTEFCCTGFRWIVTYETFPYRKTYVRTATLRAIRINVANYSHWKLSQMNALDYHWLWMKRKFSIDQFPTCEKYCMGKNENSRERDASDVNPHSILQNWTTIRLLRFAVFNNNVAFLEVCVSCVACEECKRYASVQNALEHKSFQSLVHRICRRRGSLSVWSRIVGIRHIHMKWHYVIHEHDIYLLQAVNLFALFISIST